MTSTDAAASTQAPDVGTIDMKLEVVTVAVSDVDRSKRFYQSLGWRLDADIAVGDSFRVVQLTPPHSACSVAFGIGVTTDEPGSIKRLLLAVYDINEARADLVRRGIEVSGLFHLAGGPVPGPDPQGRSYQTYASFSDPDGNGWLLQEIKTRLPGREWEDLTGTIASRAAAEGDGRASRSVREVARPAQLVGLVRRLHGRARAGAHAGRGGGGRGPLHAGRAAHRGAVARAAAAAAARGAAAGTALRARLSVGRQPEAVRRMPLRAGGPRRGSSGPACDSSASPRPAPADHRAGTATPHASRSAAGQHATCSRCSRSAWSCSRS